MPLRPEDRQILRISPMALAGGDAHLHHPIGWHQHTRQSNGLPGAAEEPSHRRG